MNLITLRKNFQHLVDYPNLSKMQFTGLKDKNGKDIYEGDIIKFGNGKVFPVEHGHCSCTADDNYCCGEAFGFHLNGEILGNDEIWGEEKTTSDHIEVIGNIFENADLLTQTKRR